MNRILIFGGTGTLGKELVEKYRAEHYIVWAPTRKEIDITQIWLHAYEMHNFNPDIIIHAAGLVDLERCEEDPSLAIKENIISTCELVRVISQLKAKFVYISTEYIFGGNKGNYTIDDKLDPINVYGKSKAAAEYIVSILPNHQIIRVPFFSSYHKKAYTDQFVSRTTVERAANLIFDCVNNNKNKLVHLVHNTRDSVYNHYKKLGLDVEPITIPDNLKYITPKDSSLV